MTSFACLVFPSAHVSDRDLSRGFAVALAGFDVRSPKLLVTPARGLPGWSVAFYRSGQLEPFEELDHACEVFEDELPPGLAVREEVVGKPSGAPVVIHAFVCSDEIVHDAWWRFSDATIRTASIFDDEDGLLAVRESEDGVVSEEIELPDDATEVEIEKLVAPHRGTTWASRELGPSLLAAVMGALYEADRAVQVHLVDPSPESIADETRALLRTLKRVEGRGAEPLPDTCGGVARPASVAAFAATYDWADPADPGDLYRELALGRVEGTLRFARSEAVRALDADPTWSAAAKAGLYPLATLARGGLGGSGRPSALVGVRADGSSLALVESERIVEAGPTLGELVAYLALGFRSRDDYEEDRIGALMLRARVRAPA